MSTRKAAVTQIRLLPLRLVHGWDRIKNSIFFSLLALSNHKNVKCYPTMTKSERVLLPQGFRA